MFLHILRIFPVFVPMHTCILPIAPPRHHLRTCCTQPTDNSTSCILFIPTTHIIALVASPGVYVAFFEHANSHTQILIASYSLSPPAPSANIQFCRRSCSVCLPLSVSLSYSICVVISTTPLVLCISISASLIELNLFPFFWIHFCLCRSLRIGS